MYMPKPLAYGLSIQNGENLVLQSVEVDVVFNNLLSETAITQTYRNLEQYPVEAVYTFPLAGQAVLLDLAVTLGDRKLRGRVVKKSTAEEQYEEAVLQGDAAIMLEQAQSGIYTMNMGDILASETVVIVITTAELHTWYENTLRFLLPTTIAPRYGDLEKASLQPHQIPDSNLLTEHRFQLKLTLTGVLAQAQLECPSHQVTISAGATTTVQLAAGEACMDRDFILNIRLPQTPPDTLQIDHDLDNSWVALASFVPKLPIPESLPPKNIKIVVDCSRSMAGDSINQARQAVSDILSLLRAEDYFNIILFGTSHQQVFEKQVPATSEHITQVRRMLRSVEADMGGAEMQAALLATVDIPGPSIPQDILLITDGEIWQAEELVATMRRTAHRVFAVGVGSAVAEQGLRSLAHETGGACELVSPQEGMAAKIVRHFQRILLPRTGKVAVYWPTKPLQVIPRDIGPIFHGDTVHVFARFPTLPAGTVSLEMWLEDGRSLKQKVHLEHPLSANQNAIPQPSTLARLAIASSLNDQEEAIATDLAIRYQLVSPYTNVLVVDEREEEYQAKTLPVLRKVSQMMAAGWGGTGTVVCRSPQAVEDIAAYPKPNSGVRFSVAPNPEQRYKWRQRTTPSSFIYNCNCRHTRWLRPVLEVTSYDDLDACELPARILDAIASIAGQVVPEPSEGDVVLAFLYALLQSPVVGVFDRTTRRTIKKCVKNCGVDRQLLELMRAAFADISESDWGPNYPLLEKDEASGDTND